MTDDFYFFNQKSAQLCVLLGNLQLSGQIDRLVILFLTFIFRQSAAEQKQRVVVASQFGIHLIYFNSFR